MSNKTSDKNVAKVTKSDIDILNALIYVYEARLPNYNELMDSEVKSLKNILAEREQMLKAINVVEKEKADWIKAYQEGKDSQFDLLRQIQELEEELKGRTDNTNKLIEVTNLYLNSIPKQVVIDKIKSLKNMLKATTEGIWQEYTVEEIIIKINTFEELLEDK